MKLKTSELLTMLISISQESAVCEDKVFQEAVSDVFMGKKAGAYVTHYDIICIAKALTETARFSSIRTTCKLLQELGIIEPDVDVFDNEQLKKYVDITID